MECFAKIVNHFLDVNYLPKTLHVSCLTLFWWRLYKLIRSGSSTKLSAFFSILMKVLKFFYNIFKALQIATEHGEASKKSNILARKSLIGKYIVISINASNGFAVNDFVCYENLIVCLILTYGTVKVYRLFSKISH